MKNLFYKYLQRLLTLYIHTWSIHALYCNPLRKNEIVQICRHREYSCNNLQPHTYHECKVHHKQTNSLIGWKSLKCKSIKPKNLHLSKPVQSDSGPLRLNRHFRTSQLWCNFTVMQRLSSFRGEIVLVWFCWDQRTHPL